MQSILTIDPARSCGFAFARRRNNAWSPYTSETVDLSKVSGTGLVLLSFRAELADIISKYHPTFIAFEMPTPRSMPAGRLQLAMVGIIQMMAQEFRIDSGWCLPNDIKKFHMGKDAFKKGSKDRLHDIMVRRFSVGKNSDETDALALLDMLVQTQATGEYKKWLKMQVIK
jgi:Holliday junction resolvasome RuvABC endonuclease subunit